MSRASRQRLREAKLRQPKKKLRWILPLVVIAFIAAAFVTWNHFKLRTEKPSGIVAKSPAPFRQPRTLKELLALPPDKIEQCDIGLMNLLLTPATRLPITLT